MTVQTRILSYSIRLGILMIGKRKIMDPACIAPSKLFTFNLEPFDALQHEKVSLTIWR